MASKGIRSTVGKGVINELTAKQYRNGESLGDLETFVGGTLRDAAVGFGVFMLVCYVNKWFMFGGNA